MQTLATATEPPAWSTLDRRGRDLRRARRRRRRRRQAATLTLTDGSKLDVALGAGAPALPAGVTAAASEAELATCASCGLIETLAGGVQRVRISLAAAGGTASAGGLTLTYTGSAARIRWDVAVLP